MCFLKDLNVNYWFAKIQSHQNVSLCQPRYVLKILLKTTAQYYVEFVKFQQQHQLQRHQQRQRQSQQLQQQQQQQ